jgi:hypothetical protein
MQQLFADGQHVATAAPEIVDVVIATQDEGFTILTVTLATPEFIDIADAAGTIVQHIEAAPPGFYERVSVTLFPNGPNESWRIQAYIALTSVTIESVS